MVITSKTINIFLRVIVYRVHATSYIISMYQFEKEGRLKLSAAAAVPSQSVLVSSSVVCVSLLLVDFCPQLHWQLHWIRKKT